MDDKKNLTDLISNDSIDEIYQAAMSAAPWVESFCGAGGGGFMLLYVPPENQAKVKRN